MADKGHTEGRQMARLTIRKSECYKDETFCKGRQTAHNKKERQRKKNEKRKRKEKYKEKLKKKILKRTQREINRHQPTAHTCITQPQS